MLFRSGQGVERVNQLWHVYAAAHRDQPGGELFDHVLVESWQQNRRGMIAPMEKEQAMLLLLFLMLGVITVFIVFVVLYMIISHGSRDIGILRSVGVSTVGVATVFEGFAVLIGLVGAAAGAGGGVLFLWRINAIEDWLHRTWGWQPLWDRSVYAIGDIPSQVDPTLIAVVFVAAVGACLVGGLVPSLKAGLKRPVETLQVSQI